MTIQSSQCIECELSFAVGFRIADQGTCIESERIEGIFNMQLNPENASASGIQMHLTKSVVDKMQGKISVSGKPSEGTLITFELPNHQ